MATDYTKNPEYVAAFKKLQELNIELYGYKGYANGLDAQLEQIAQEKGENSKEFKTAQAKFLSLKKQFDATQKQVDSFKIAAEKQKSEAKAAATAEKAVSSAEAKIADLEKKMGPLRRQGLTAEAEKIQAQIDAIRLQSAVATGKAPEGAPTGATVEEVNKSLDQQIKNARKLIVGMSGPERKAFAQTLLDAGYEVTPTEALQESLILQYQAALTQAKTNNTSNKDLLPALDFTQYLTQRTALTNEMKGIAGAGAGGAGGTTTSVSVSAPTEAAGLIQPLFKSLLGRDATAQEVKNITTQLNKAEKDPKNAVKTTRDAAGNVVYTGGIDRGQFITQIIQTVPEFKTKKADKATLTTQDLITTANANGIKLSQDQINNWTAEVQSGGDINVIKNKIRTIASMGQPDSVKKLMAEGTDLETLYSPYKQRMASSLGVNVNTITLDDPTLRMAIGPDKEMSLYEFSKAIRKDNRWKYSQEANDEVTSMIDQVKRDFGFVG